MPRNSCLTLMPNSLTRVMAQYRGYPLPSDDFSSFLWALKHLGFEAFQDRDDDLLERLGPDALEFMQRAKLGFNFPLDRRADAVRFKNGTDLYTDKGQILIRGQPEDLGQFLFFHAQDEAMKLGRLGDIVLELQYSPFAYDPAKFSRVLGGRFVPAGKNGLAPDYSSLEDMLYLGSRESSITKIILTGRRDLDEQVAMAALGFERKKSDLYIQPRGTVWHHLDDWNPVTGEGTMQLILREFHMGSIWGPDHIGGAAIWKHFYALKNFY